MVKAVLPTMRRQKSVRGYCNASKFAVEGLTESLRLEVKPFGIRVSMIELAAEHPDFCASAFVGVIDPVEMTLSYASAGHPAPLLRYPDGVIAELVTAALMGVRAVRRLHPQPKGRPYQSEAKDTPTLTR